MKIEGLHWDSEFFGLKIGKVIVEDTDFDWQSFKKEANAEKYDLIYIFKFKKMFLKDIILKADIELVDIHLTMLKKFNKNDYLNVPYDFRTELTEKEKKECYKIAEATSVVSRFHREKMIGAQKTRELYQKWIDNTLNKSFSDGLFLAKHLNTVTGIHLIRTDNINKIGYFTLSGVYPNKRKGIGKKLWETSFGYWANNSDITIIKSPFSFLNLGSFNFHLKMGFNRVEETKYIYHYRNK